MRVYMCVYICMCVYIYMYTYMYVFSYALQAYIPCKSFMQILETHLADLLGISADGAKLLLEPPAFKLRVCLITRPLSHWRLCNTKKDCRRM